MWLAAFRDLEEDGPHGHLDFARCGVVEFDGEVGGWVAALKSSIDETSNVALYDGRYVRAVDVTADTFVEVADPNAFGTALCSALHMSMAHSSVMLKENVAKAWGERWMESMAGSRFFRLDQMPITGATFEACFAAVMGNRVAWILVEDED